MSPKTLVFIGAGKHGEGCGGGKSRKTEVGDASLRSRLVFVENVGLKTGR